MQTDPAPLLTAALRDWCTERFEQTLKQEILALDAGCLPLVHGTCEGGQVDTGNLAVSVFGSRERGATIEARIGVFFNEVIGGCSCGDDPFTRPASCLLRVTIDKING
ncbi:MAG: hypothetical protein R3308_11330 [Thiohalobacterales bacterium]|nr:hypothetical protein [Thiohalobacterales bacterium]